MDNLTKKQRAEVVELLRCAADNAIRDYYNGSALGVAAMHLGICTLPYLSPVLGSDTHWSKLLRGRGPIQDAPPWFICAAGYEFCLLEAAQRVEEGSWP